MNAAVRATPTAVSSLAEPAPVWRNRASTRPPRSTTAIVIGAEDRDCAAAVTIAFVSLADSEEKDAGGALPMEPSLHVSGRDGASRHEEASGAGSSCANDETAATTLSASTNAFMKPHN